MNLALRDVVEATVGQRRLAGHRAIGNSPLSTEYWLSVVELGDALT